MSPTQGMSLHPALLADAPTLAEIHNDAFANDVFMELVYGPLADNLGPLTEDLEQLIRDNPNARLLKAVDDESGRILGWTWWNIYRDAEAHLQARQKAREKMDTPPPTSISPQAYKDSRRRVLETREKRVPGAVAILQVLVVRPECQGRGVGSQLLMAGVEEAKNLHLPAWLEATAAGYQLYQKAGFHNAASLDFDLANYGGSGSRRVHCMLMDDVKTNDAQ